MNVEIPKTSEIASRMIAPARMISERLLSRLKAFCRSSTVEALASCLTVSEMSLPLKANLFIVFGSALPERAWMSLATVSAVPEEATAISCPNSAISDCSTINVERTKARQLPTALGCKAAVLKKRSVSRTAPSLKLRAIISSSSLPRTISVDPPPISHKNMVLSGSPMPCSAPR